MSSFKSKQRAKHGHLFGDDPLNAALVSSTDDPLFSSNSRTTSQSSRTNSPVSSDPLSRPSSNGPLDFSSSTPISTSPRRAQAKTNGSSSPSSGSIFGDIDVSKLGTSNGHSKRVSNTSLRSTATLRSTKQYDLDGEEDLLFGGKSSTRTRVNSKASPVASIHTKSPIVANTSLPPKQEEETVIPTPRKSSPPPPPPPTAVVTSKETQEQKPTVSSSSSSFFRFFKSNTTPSKPVSSASSAVSVNAPSSPVTNDAVNITPPPPPPSRQQISRTPVKPMIQQHVAEEEVEEEEQVNHHIIEDEATRAFADDVMTFTRTRPTQYFPPELTMDALRIDTPPNSNKRLIPSVSTPTATTVDDPWSGLRQPILLNGSIEPSVSSPLVIKEQDIEPEKRNAFADLIASWNTGQQKQESTTTIEDPEQFFSHVAEEQRDIGFAGIGEIQEDQTGHVMVDWVHEEENPWS